MCALLLYAKSWTHGGGRRKMRADDLASLSSADIPECINSFTSLCCEFWSAFFHKELVMLCSLIVLCALFELWNFCIVRALSGCEELSKKDLYISENEPSFRGFEIWLHIFFFTWRPAWFMFLKKRGFSNDSFQASQLCKWFFVFFCRSDVIAAFCQKKTFNSFVPQRYTPASHNGESKGMC